MVNEGSREVGRCKFVTKDAPRGGCMLKKAVKRSRIGFFAQESGRPPKNRNPRSKKWQIAQE